MSHLVSIKDVKLVNKEALQVALSRMNNVQQLGEGQHQLWGGNTVNGLGLRLQGKNLAGEQCSAWTYPLVVKEDGTVTYDNYGGSWGKQILLDELVQQYSAAIVEMEAMQQGLSVESETQENGDMVLTCSGY